MCILLVLRIAGAVCTRTCDTPVSYTHLDVYKRQPKSITTAIGMGISEEAGGIVTLTVMSIILTGVLGNMAGETVLKPVSYTHLAVSNAVGRQFYKLPIRPEDVLEALSLVK